MGEPTVASPRDDRVGLDADWKRIGAAEVGTIETARFKYRVSVVHLRACGLLPGQQTHPEKTRVSIQVWRRGPVSDWSLRNELRLPLHKVGAVAEALRR